MSIFKPDIRSLQEFTPQKSPVLSGNWRTLWAYRHLLLNLVRKDIRVRYMGAALGFAWSLANPLVITIMYLLVFTYLFPSNLPDYPLFIVTGMIHWMFFSQVITQSSDVLVANSGLVKKIYFPRLLIPTSTLCTNLTLWSGTLAIYLVLYTLILGGHFNWVQLLYPVYFALFLIVIWGLSLCLCTFYVRFRDLKHLVEVAIQVLFWGTPIVYSISHVPPIAKLILAISPVTEFILICQDLFYWRVAPTWHLTLALAAWAVVLGGVGTYFFERRVPHLIEEL